MLSLTVPKSVRAHAPWIILLLLVQIFVDQVASTAFHLFVRPRLVATGARPCTPDMARLVSAEARGAHCDVMTTQSTVGVTSRIGYASSGLIKVTENSRGDVSVFYAGHAIELLLPILAFLVYLATLLRKMARSGVVSSWGLASVASDDIEILLRWYSVPLMLLGIARPLIRG
ncbi:MAG TPA: hypothetical protein VF824_18825 [Thermoanaerobaculia bacterium]|jgi:hypothetical protein